MSVIASLIVEIKAEIAELVSGARAATEHLANIRNASQEVADGLHQVEEAGKTVAEALGLAFTIDKAVEFTASVVELGSHLENLKAQTAASVDALQRWASVGEEFGVSVDSIAEAMDKLGARLVANQSATRALGLSMTELTAATPDQRLLTVAVALGNVESQTTKAELANQLLGRSFATMLPILNKDLPDALKSVQTVMDDTTAKSLHDFDVQTKTLTTNLKVLAAEGLAGVADGLNVVLTNFNKGRDIWTTLGLFVGGEIGNRSMVALANDLAAPGKRGDITLPGANSQLTDNQLAQNVVLGYQTEALKGLSAAQEHYLEQLFDINKLTVENAKLMGISADQMEIFKAKEDALITQQGNFATQLREITNLAVELGNKYGKTLDDLNGRAMHLLETQTRIRSEMMMQGAAAIAAVNDRNQPALSPFDQALANRDSAYRDIANKESLAPGVTVQGVDVYAAMRAKAEADFDAEIAGLTTRTTQVDTALSTIPPAAIAASQAVGGFSMAIARAWAPLMPLYDYLKDRNSVGTPYVEGATTESLFAGKPTQQLFTFNINTAGMFASKDQLIEDMKTSMVNSAKSMRFFGSA